MLSVHELSVSQLRQAVKLREQIEHLQKKLAILLQGTAALTTVPVAKSKRGGKWQVGKRTMSAAARAKIAAAQKARWAKAKGVSTK